LSNVLIAKYGISSTKCLVIVVQIEVQEVIM